MLVSIPTRDRPDSLALALVGLISGLEKRSEVRIYDDGDSQALAHAGVRFGLDVLTRLDHAVEIRRGKALGIKAARARMLSEAASTRHSYFVMLDDDVIVQPDTLTQLLDGLGHNDPVQYAVPVVRLANNEAGIEQFERSHEPEWNIQNRTITWVPTGKGSWTCCIAMDLSRIDMDQAITSVIEGPQVAEDYALTAPLLGMVIGSAHVWHAMGPDQGARAWNSLALMELRKQVGGGT